MSAHTQAPWITARRNRYAVDVYVSTDAQHEIAGRLIASVNDAYGTGEADARLVAAAPDLLAALKRCRDMLLAIANAREDTAFECLGPAHDAIAKAEGAA